MNLAYHIARRYLISRKKHNAVNIISAVSVCGVTLATLAMVCTLSVFNGFQEMVADLFTAFDPQLKISAARGKVFDPRDSLLLQVRDMPEVALCVQTLEENAVVQYKENQVMVTIKGVEDSFRQLTDIDSLLFGAGRFVLHDEVVDYGVMGGELVSQLGTGIQHVDPLQVYAPRRDMRVNMANPSASFRRDYLFSSGVVFVVGQSEYDAHYILTSLSFARRLFDRPVDVSALELKLAPGANAASVERKIARLLGDDYVVENRYEQQADVFRVMEIEKMVSYLFLVFILVIAGFNIIGSLSMLILDKSDDVATLHKLGADRRFITRIFLFEGSLISLFGAVLGIVLGLLLCLLQQRFGLIALGGGDGSFIVDAYPVSVHAADVLVVFATVLVVGFLSVWYPVRFFTRKGR
ncbi:MAG: FtsX-like permease family protein [Prevotellaceae bacterium]|jgi:lipoprotein-releasing system permease protein|nr:FtsX-like permease family protein [Prevotellaceae bacterium]